MRSHSRGVRWKGVMFWQALIRLLTTLAVVGLALAPVTASVALLIVLVGLYTGWLGRQGLQHDPEAHAAEATAMRSLRGARTVRWKGVMFWQALIRLLTTLAVVGLALAPVTASRPPPEWSAAG
jgi:hypothetical protein